MSRKDQVVSRGRGSVRSPKSVVIAFVVVALVAWLLLATAGRDCHFNVHFAKKVVCADDRTPPADDAGDRGSS